MHVEYLEHSHAEASVLQRGARSIWVQRSAALWISSLSRNTMNDDDELKAGDDRLWGWSHETEKNLEDTKI